MMKHSPIKNRIISGLVAGLLFLFFIPNIGFSDDMFGYEKKNKEEEKKAYIEKLKNDKDKTDLAIINTQSLIKKSRNRPYLPELYLRLAELYVEKSRLSYFLRKSLGDGHASTLDKLESDTYKNRALEVYGRILDQFPGFPGNDKVHFFMAHEYRELGNTDEMIRHYRAIIKQYKDSDYVPEAYLLLGDYFIAQSDINLAKSQYENVLKYPKSQASVIAHYKLAWCHINNGDYKKALSLFEETVKGQELSDEDLDVDTYKRVDIKQEALMDLAYCYTEVYRKNTPEAALAYFRDYAWSRQVYVLVLEKLAYRYFLKKKWNHSAAIYRELCALQHDTVKLLDYSRSIFECVQSTGSFDMADKDMAFMVKALKKQKYSIHVPDEEKDKNEKDYEKYARELATHIHQKALKNKSKDSYKRAADAYKVYLDYFEKSPERSKMNANYAEALFSSGQYLEAGKQYEKMAKEPGIEAGSKKEQLYSAVISYHSAIKNKKNLNYYQTAYAQDGLRTTGKLYAKAFPGSPNVPEVLFNVAWISYDAGKYEDAIEEFTDFVKKYPAGKPAGAAVHLTLDAYHMKGDEEGLVRYGKKVVENKKIRDLKLKKEVAGIVKNAESKLVSDLTIAAMDDWQKGKENLLDFVKDSKHTGMAEQALNALIVSAKEKNDLITLFHAGDQLISTYPKSEHVKGTLGTLIDTSINMSQFRMLANYLEIYASKFPMDNNSKEFLVQAGRIRSELEEYPQANRTFERVLKYNSLRVPFREEIVFLMADNYSKQQEFEKAAYILEDNLKYVSASVRVKAYAKASAFLYQAGSIRKAEKYRNKASRGIASIKSTKDKSLAYAISEMNFHGTHRYYNTYMNLQLGKTLNNKIVTRKAELLQLLEAGYGKVLKSKSPEWILAGCYHAYEVNREFAGFLLEAPLPDLDPSQTENYKNLIREKAAGYTKKADEYKNAYIKQAQKWEACRPEFISHVELSSDSENEKKIGSFSGNTANTDIYLKDFVNTSLGETHRKLLESPKDIKLLSELSGGYVKQGDFLHSMLVSKNALSETKEKKTQDLSGLYNNLGVSYLLAGKDEYAKDAFKKAINCDPGNIGAKVNLAALYKYYGYMEASYLLYESLPSAKRVDKSESYIHPKAKALYYEQAGVKRKTYANK